jgi:ABC-type dipeptide/oligopeptide/nickel transport system permease component
LRLWKYIIRRVLYLIPLFIGISIIVFILTRLSGDPVNLMTALNPKISLETKNLLREYFGLSGNLLDQYIRWMSNFLRGDFGYSYSNRVSVNQILGWYTLNTLELQILALLLSIAIAIPIGVMSARKQYTKTDMTVTTASLLGISIPVFFMGVVYIIIFGYFLQWFPYGGLVSSPVHGYIYGSYFIDHLWHLVMPLAVLTFADMATIVLLVRGSMLEVLRQDYILAATASGLSERAVIYKHALRNTLIPVVTYIGLYLGGMLAGAPITETVFNWPGLGALYVSATNALDFPVIQAITILVTLMTLFANLATDIIYAYIDPRIRLD